MSKTATPQHKFFQQNIMLRNFMKMYKFTLYVIKSIDSLKKQCV